MVPLCEIRLSKVCKEMGSILSDAVFALLGALTYWISQGHWKIGLPIKPYWNYDGLSLFS